VDCANRCSEKCFLKGWAGGIGDEFGNNCNKELSLVENKVLQKILRHKERK
jgi:hypothetical protein